MGEEVLKAYIFMDSPAYLPGDLIKVGFSVINYLSDVKEVEYDLRLSLNEKEFWSERGKIFLIRGEEKVLEWGLNLPFKTGILKAIATFSWVGGKLLAEKTARVSEPPDNPVRLIMVWHQHQPPSYLPNGRYKWDYPFRWVWYNLFNGGYTGGPYYVHAKLLLKYGDVKTVQHLSPSLLKQWVDAIENGYRLETGEYYDQDSREVKMVREALKMFKELSKNGTIELLTSVYAHTISGYLVSKYGMLDVVEEELELGYDITKAVFGVDVKGVWTPEMAWDQQLVEVYSRKGFEYTILCGRNHFPGATGDKESIYEPYIVRENGYELKIFFRDQGLSDTIGFGNNFPELVEAEDGAYNLASRMLDYKGTLVLALDGENWMIFSKYPQNTARHLDKLYEYIKRLQDKGFLRTVLPSEVLQEAEKILTYIPTTSWLGSFTKWDGEIRDQRRYWKRVNEAYKRVKVLENAVQGVCPLLREAKWAFYHAIDSDYWWADFWSPEIIDNWLDETSKVLQHFISKIILRPHTYRIRVKQREEANLKLEVINYLDNILNLYLVLPSYVTPYNTINLTIKPGKNLVEVRLKPSLWGFLKAPILLTSGDYILAQTAVELNIDPNY